MLSRDPKRSPARPVRPLARALIASMALAAPLAAQEGDIADEARHRRTMAAVQIDSVQLRQLGMAVFIHAQEHGKLPADMAALEPYLGRDARRWRERGAYIGRADLAPDDLADWGNTAVGHLRLELAHAVEPGPGNAEGLLCPVLFLDGHVEVLTASEAAALIAESVRVLEATATGAPLPDGRQAVWNAQAIIRAVRAYAADHEGRLPPDLGSTLEYMAADPRRAATAQQRARAYLSPRAARDTHVPEEPTPEWVNRHASYLYLGDAGALLGCVEVPDRTILLHARLDEPVPGARPDSGPPRLITIATASGRAANESRPYVEAVIEESRAIVDSARSGKPLPDHAQAIRDLRLIGEALGRYAATHDGLLPPDLGELLDLVPDDPTRDALAPLDGRRRASTFLSPRAERVAQAPDEPTAEWVRRYSTYTYLGAGLPWDAVRRAGVSVLVHAPLDEAIPLVLPGAGDEAGGATPMVPVLMGFGVPILMPRDGIERIVEESRDSIAALRARER